MSEQMHTIKVFVVSHSNKAWLIEHNGTKAWVARSLVEKMKTDNTGHGDITIPDWLYRKHWS